MGRKRTIALKAAREGRTPAAAPAPAQVPLPAFTLPIRGAPREEDSRGDTPAETAAAEWDFVPTDKMGHDDDDDDSDDGPSELPVYSQAATVKTFNSASQLYRPTTYYDGQAYTGKEANMAKWLKTIQDKFGKRVEDLLDERLLPDPDPFQWNPNMLRILRKVVLDCRTEEQVNEVLWAGVKSETVVYAWEDYPLTPSIVKFARQHWEAEYKSKSKPESDSEDDENVEEEENVKDE